MASETDIKKQIIQEIEQVPEMLLEEVLDFLQFVKAKRLRKPDLSKSSWLKTTAKDVSGRTLSESSLEKDWSKPEEVDTPTLKKTLDSLRR